MDSPKKQANSVKHLEFQLQREKNLTKDLSDKCKEFQRQIAQLEQDKAELRRERMMAGDDGKKCERLEERIHNLQKDVEQKDQLIVIERNRAQEAASETERVRRNAETAIASWTAAEAQWVAEQEALNSMVITLKNKLKETEDTVKSLKIDGDLLRKNLQKEKELTKRLENSLDGGQSEMQSYREQAEKLRHRVAELEQSVYELDLAGDKQKEALTLKETEIKMLENTIAKLKDNEEKMEQTISEMNDRVSAAKLLNLDSKGENEKLLCDLSEQRKEIQRLNLQLESTRKDLTLATNSQASLQKSLEEAKEKNRNYQEQIKEKSVELRSQELTVTQLKVDIQRKENTINELTFRCNTLESEVEQSQTENKKLQQSYRDLEEEKQNALAEIKKLQARAETREEEIVLMQSNLVDEVEELKKEIKRLEEEGATRQALLNDLTGQLGETSSQNQIYQSRILEESDMIKFYKGENKSLTEQIHEMEQKLCAEQSSVAKLDYFIHVSSEAATVLFSEWSSLQIHAIREVEHKNTMLADSLQQAEASLHEKDTIIQNLSQQLSSTQEELLVQQAKLSETEQMLSNTQVSAENNAHAFSEQMRQTSSSHEAVQNHLSDLNELFCEHLSNKCDVALAQYSQSTEICTRFVQEFTNEMESLKNKNKELSIFAKEAKETLNGRNLKLMEKLQELKSNAESLEKLLAAERETNAALQGEISQLQERVQKEQESQQKMSQSLAESEAACTQLRTECGKLRNGVEYEVKRKCEYKAAVTELKELRKQSELNREKEKELAGAAISKANFEIQYWVRCFDKLKHMVESSKKHGSQVSVEPEVLTRLAEVKSRMAKFNEQQQQQQQSRAETTDTENHALQSQNTNSLPVPVGVKRPRLESDTTAPQI